jgi:hypothetical protein
MSTLSPNLSLQYLVEGQFGAEFTHNGALNALDALCHLAVKDRNLAAPPGSPANGDRYLVAASPTGAWAGQAGKIAYYYSGWQFHTPKEGWRMWIDDEDILVVYTGSVWKQFWPANVFCGYDSAGGTNLAAGWADIPWGTEIRKGSLYTHTAAAATITVLEAGDYFVAADVGAVVGGSGSTAEMRIQKNGADVVGSLSCSEDGRGDGLSLTATMVVNCAANDVLKVQGQRRSGTGTVVTRANASRITIRRLD